MTTLTNKHRLQELGSIRSIDGNEFTVFGHAQYQLMTNDLIITDIVLSSIVDGELYSIHSLAEMPDCFSQNAITILEEDIILDKVNARMDHLSDLHSESKWESNV